MRGSAAFHFRGERYVPAKTGPYRLSSGGFTGSCISSDSAPISPSPSIWAGRRPVCTRSWTPPVRSRTRASFSFSSFSSALVAGAHALVRGVAGIGHGRGGYLDALQGAQSLLLLQMAAAFHAAMDALFFRLGHGKTLLLNAGIRRIACAHFILAMRGKIWYHTPGRLFSALGRCVLRRATRPK